MATWNVTMGLTATRRVCIVCKDTPSLFVVFLILMLICLAMVCLIPRMSLRDSLFAVH